MNAIFHRTSVRQFEDREIPQDMVDQLLRAAMQAPTAGNQQNWEFYVVTNKEVIEKLSQASQYAGCAKNAPMVIVITYKEGARFPELNDIDCAIATENIWLEADTLGLGTVMLAVAPFEDRMKAVKEALNLSDNEYAFTIMPVGFPIKEAKQQSRFDEKKVHYVK